MENKYALYFDPTGCIGLRVPEESDATVRAEQRAFLERIARAVQRFDEDLQEIDAAYQAGRTGREVKNGN